MARPVSGLERCSHPRNHRKEEEEKEEEAEEGEEGEEGDSGRHEAKKEEGGERERETGTEREPPLGYLSRAARFADRIRPSPLALSSCRRLSPSTDRSSHPFPSLAHGEPSSHGDPVVREPHCDEGPGETRYERPSVPLPPKSPHTLFLNPRAVSRRSLLPSSTSYSSPLLCFSLSLFLPMSLVLLSRITPRRDRVLSPLAPSTYVYIADTCEHVYSHVRADVRAFSRIRGG